MAVAERPPPTRRRALAALLAALAACLISPLRDTGAQGVVRVVVIEGRTTRNYASETGTRVLERQTQTLTDVLENTRGVVLQFSPARTFRRNLGIADRAEGLWENEFAAGRLDVARAQESLRPIGAQVAVGLFFAPEIDANIGGRTTVHVLDLDSGAVYTAHAAGKGDRFVSAFQQAFEQALTHR